MNQRQWVETIKSMKVGKRLPTALYVHQSVELPLEVKTMIEYAERELRVMKNEYNVLKLGTKYMEVSFLNYPNFFDNDHPVLAWCLKVNLETNTGKEMDYSKRENPPILHRKETFLEPNHLMVSEFRAMTAWEESQGWYEKPKTIGTKNGWLKVTNGKSYPRSSK